MTKPEVGRCPTSTSEGDNTDAFEQGGTRVDGQLAMDSIIAEQGESADAASAHSRGKIDPQAPGWLDQKVCDFYFLNLLLVAIYIL